MNKRVIPHYDEAKMRLLEAKALITAVSSEDNLTTLSPDMIATAMQGIENLIESGEKDLDRMLDAVRVGEVLT